MTGTKFTVQIGLLGTDNWILWSIKMRALLCAEGLWAVVDPDSKAKSAEKNSKALGILILHLEEFQLQTAASYDSARELWKHFASTYQAKSNARRALLRKQLLSLRMERGEGISKFVERSKGLWTELKATGHEMSETEVCWTILSALPKQFGMICPDAAALGRCVRIGGHSCEAE